LRSSAPRGRRAAAVGSGAYPSGIVFVDPLTATKINPGRSTLLGLLQVVASACRLL
jgi:hypothetical protein